MSDVRKQLRHREAVRIAILELIAQERARQILRYGNNDELYDGSGPDTRWLEPYTTRPARDIERDLRADYVTFEAETGQPTWVHLIREEVAEAFQETEPSQLVEELVQVAALCVSWCEQLYLRGARPLPAADEEEVTA